MTGNSTRDKIKMIVKKEMLHHETTKLGGKGGQNEKKLGLFYCFLYGITGYLNFSK
jgi:hypothetical protein